MRRPGEVKARSNGVGGVVLVGDDDRVEPGQRLARRRCAGHRAPSRQVEHDRALAEPRVAVEDRDLPERNESRP